MKQNILVAMLIIIMAVIVYRIVRHHPFSTGRKQPAHAGKPVDTGLDFPPSGNGLLISKLFY